MGDKRVGVRCRLKQHRPASSQSRCNCFSAHRRGQRSPRLVNINQGRTHIQRSVPTITALGRDRAHHHIHKLWRQVCKTGQISRVRCRRRRWFRTVPRIPTGERFVKRQTQRIDIAVSAVSVVGNDFGVEVRWQVPPGAASARFAVVRPNRNVEVDDLRALLGPEQIARFDIAVVEALLMQVNQPLDYLLSQLQRIFRGQQALLDHVADIGPFDVLKHHEGNLRALWAGQHIGIQHADHIGVIRNLHEVAVFLLQPLQRGVAVADHQLQRSRYVTQRVDHLVDDAESALPKLLLDDELVGERMPLRQIAIVQLGFVCFSWKWRICPR